MEYCESWNIKWLFQSVCNEVSDMRRAWNAIPVQFVPGQQADFDCDVPYEIGNR